MPETEPLGQEVITITDYREDSDSAQTIHITMYMESQARSTLICGLRQTPTLILANVNIDGLWFSIDRQHIMKGFIK